MPLAAPKVSRSPTYWGGRWWTGIFTFPARQSGCSGRNSWAARSPPPRLHSTRPSAPSLQSKKPPHIRVHRPLAVIRNPSKNFFPGRFFSLVEKCSTPRGEGKEYTCRSLAQAKPPRTPTRRRFDHFLISGAPPNELAFFGRRFIASHL